jgi:histidinol-phosphate aminotransferase
MIRDAICKLEEYKAGKSVEEVRRRYGVEKVIKLASNENPYGASPKAIKAFKSFKSLHVYPETDPLDLREKIAKYIGFNENRIVVGAGIDGILENVFKLFVSEGDEVIIPTPSFPYYHILTGIYGSREIRIKRRDDFSIDANAILDAMNKKTKLVIICSPNNPTGNTEDQRVISEIVKNSDAMIFIDEAYAEFSSKNLLGLAENENVIIARTFSKAFGLANLRLGYAVVPEQLRGYFKKVSTPFPISTPAKLAAIAALEDKEHLKMVVEKTRSERNRIAKKLNKLGVKAYPSEANFIFVEVPIKAPLLTEELLRRGIIIRDCSNFIGCNEFQVRVSVGKRLENDRFLKTMEEVL